MESSCLAGNTISGALVVIRTDADDGSFGNRGTSGMLAAIKSCRENNIPFLGIVSHAQTWLRIGQFTYGNSVSECSSL